MNKCVYFENNYVQNTHELQYDNPDVYKAVTIDGFPKDENEEGTVIAQIFITKNGDLVTAWHDNSYRLNDKVIDLIKESKLSLLSDYETNSDLYDNTKETRLSDFYKRME